MFIALIVYLNAMAWVKILHFAHSPLYAIRSRGARARFRVMRFRVVASNTAQADLGDGYISLDRPRE